MQRRRVYLGCLSILALLVLTMVGVNVFRMISSRLAAGKFSDSMLLFSDYGMRVFSYGFPHTRLFLDETLFENDALYNVDFYKFQVTDFTDIAVARADRCIYLLYRYRDDLKYGVFKIDLKTGAQEPVMEPDSVPAEDDYNYKLLSCSPDGKHIAFVLSGKGRAYATLAEEKHIPELETIPPGKRKMTVFVQETGEFIEVHDDCDYSKPSWFPDSQTFLFGSGGNIYKFHLADRRTEQLREGTLPSLSPDGKRLAYFAYGKLCWGNLASEAPEHEYAYRKLLQSRLDPSFIYSPEPILVWSPDGKYLMMAHYGEGGFSLEIPFPYIHFGGWDKILIFDTDTERIIYRDKLSSFHTSIAWVPTN